MVMKGDWKGAVDIVAGMGKRLPFAIDRAVNQEALRCLKFINKAFVRQGIGWKWHPLSVLTIEMRRSEGFKGTKALIRSGDYRRSVSVVRQNYAEYFVGVHRSARTKSGKKLINIAEIHERPFTFITVTQKMRKFFMAMFLQGKISAPLSPDTKFFIIIGRAPITQGFEAAKDGYNERMLMRVSHFLQYGTDLKALNKVQ
jgi:hypothetical protein